jgi:hypothetical protein
MCIFIKVASVLASMSGRAEWMAVMQLAERLLLRHCPCKLMKVLDVVGDVAGAAADAANSVRPATQQPYGGNGNVLSDGQGATPEEIARSSGGPSGGSRRGQPQVRQDLIDQWRKDRPGEPFECWRCGHSSTNPDDMHMGHRNVPTSRGGNLDPANTVLEGAACNLSAGNRGRPSPGMSCAERGSCGAPYGR